MYGVDGDWCALLQGERLEIYRQIQGVNRLPGRSKQRPCNQSQVEVRLNGMIAKGLRKSIVIIHFRSIACSAKSLLLCADWLFERKI